MGNNNTGNNIPDVTSNNNDRKYKVNKNESVRKINLELKDERMNSETNKVKKLENEIDDKLSNTKEL